MDPFDYRNGELHCEDVPAERIAREVGTPVYVYSKPELLRRYREIAAANGHSEWEADIRTTFAERWASKAPAGWWYQDESGAWKQK